MYGYMERIARINLTDRSVRYEFPEEKIIRKYLGGTGLGVYYLYKEVKKGTRWSDPENLFMILSGPMGGCPGPGALVSVVSMGAKTDSVAASQSNGRMGAFMRFCGYDGLIFEGRSEKPIYVYVTESRIEFREAEELMGMDTWTATGAIEKDLGKTEDELSIMAVGPAGEHGVLFAATCSERGHIAAHGGTGAVMASKNLKAVAVERGSKEVDFFDLEGLWHTMQELIVTKGYSSPVKTHKYGTTTGIIGNAANFMVPVKNYTSTDYETYFCLGSPSYDLHIEKKHIPCYGCAYRHCYRITVKDGEFAGQTGDEMEYETVAAVGSNAGCTDAIAVQMLGNYIDKMCMDSNETGWIMSWLMECYEKGICTKKELDGIEMTWGNSDAMFKMVRKIAYREGHIGDVLGNGLAYAAERLFDGKGRDLAIYTKRGNTPRGHDHRGLQNHILDTATGGIGTDEIGVLFPNLKALGLPEDLDKGTAEDCGRIVAACYRKTNY